MAPRSRVDAKNVTEDKLVSKLATKVQLLSIDRRSAEHVKRSRAENLVRRLLAVKIAACIYQRVRVRPSYEISSHPSRDFYAPPSQSVHGASVRWEPPKTPLTPLKAHPWASL